MNTIQAKPTRYKGCHFRSRLEARWAVLFDESGIDWEYEPTSLQRDDGTLWIPDFYLPSLEAFGRRFEPVTGCYAEVKGSVTQNEWRQFISAIEGGSSFPNTGLLILTDIPHLDNHSCLFAPYCYWHEGVECIFVDVHETGLIACPELGSREMYGMIGKDVEKVIKTRTFQTQRSIPAAVASARSARFEHGECGPT